MNALLQRMAADPNVEYAVADERRWPHALPGDPLFADQWYFQSVEIAATRAEQAWDVTVGSNMTVVAVIDTGVRFEHPDLLRVSQAGKLLDGFDFVSQTPFANDGDGRDADASDPGDWVSAADRTQAPFNFCMRPRRNRPRGQFLARHARFELDRGADEQRGRRGRHGLEYVDPAGARARQMWRDGQRHHRRHALGSRHHGAGRAGQSDAGAASSISVSAAPARARPPTSRPSTRSLRAVC